VPERFFLNPLKESGCVLGAPAEGQWTGDEIRKDFLINYSQDIDLGRRGTGSPGVPELDLRRVHNVPSVFARPIQFSQALADINHPLHQTVQSQWRGLLATFALRQSIGAYIQPSLFEVPAVPEAAAATAKDRNLNVILRNQLPQPFGDWEKWWVFRCAGSLIGATSPWTIVYTPAEYRVPDTIPWRDADGLFMDPIRFFDPEGQHAPNQLLAMLSQWVEQLLVAFGDTGLPAWGFKDSLKDKASSVRLALQWWKDDLKHYVDPSMGAVETMPASAIDLDPRPYKPFLTALVGPAGDGAQPGDLLAATDHDIDLIVFSKKGIPAGTRVHGAVFSGDVNLERLEKSGIGPKGWKTQSGKTVDVPYRVIEDAFFSSKILEIGLEPTALECGSSKYALPLTADFFRFFSLRTLADRREMLTVREDNNEVHVRLQIPLRNGGSLRAEKVYNRDSIAKLPGIPVPVLAVWPDFGVEDWVENYAAFGAEPHPRGEVKLLAAPILEDGTVLDRTIEEGTQDHPRQSACRVWRAEKPVIGFAFYQRDAKGESALGVVIRDPISPPKAVQQLKQWDVGIDFGTSNTQVTVKAQDESPRPLPFKRRTLVLTSAPEANIPVVTRNLFPCTKDLEPSRPLPTALRIADATRYPESGMDTKWAELNFGPERNFFATNLVANVKWGTPGAPAGDDSIKQYLTGLLRAVLCEARAEGVGQLNFRWSYPRALPLGSYGRMENFWNTVASAIDATKAIRLGTPVSMTESEAVCRYFRTQPLAGLPVDANCLSVAIDVGGGSSDVAFWLAGQLVDISSFKIAANDILVPAARFPGFAEQLATACGASGVAVEALMERPGVVINALLTQAKDPRKQACDLQRPGAHPMVRALFAQFDSGQAPWLPVRSAIYLFFMGLTYYAGLHARDIVKRHKDVGGAADNGGGGAVPGGPAVVWHQKQIGLYFGGLGSSLLTWITANDALLREVLEFSFLKGLTLDFPDGANFDIKPSGVAIDPTGTERPKEEVVMGLMADLPLGNRNAAAQVREFDTSSILCEIGWKDAQGKPVDWSHRMTAERFREMKAPRNHDSGYMAQFLGNVLLKKAGSLVVDDKGLSGLEIDGAQLQNLIAQSSEGDQTVLQPVFAFELKTMIDQYLRTANR
jgi:hypothetical protein